MNLIVVVVIAVAIMVGRIIEMLLQSMPATEITITGCAVWHDIQYLVPLKIEEGEESDKNDSNGSRGKGWPSYQTFKELVILTVRSRT